MTKSPDLKWSRNSGDFVKIFRGGRGRVAIVVCDMFFWVETSSKGKTMVNNPLFFGLLLSWRYLSHGGRLTEKALILPQFSTEKPLQENRNSKPSTRPWTLMEMVPGD